LSTDPEGDSSLRRRTAVNSASNVGGTVFGLAVGFAVTPFILHRVGATSYGLWMLAISLVSYGALLDFGVCNAVTKYVASYRRQGDVDRLGGVVATGLLALLAAGLIVLLATAVLAAIFPLAFNVSKADEATSRWLVVLSGLSVAVTLPSGIPLAVLRGLQRFDLVNLISTAGVALNAGLAISVVALGGGVVAVAAAYLPLELAMQVPMVLAIRRTAPELKLGFRGATREFARSVASFGAAQFVMGVSAQARIRAPEAVIGAFLPVGRVTSYTIARRLGAIPNMLSDQFVNVLMPLASHLHAGNERSRLRAVQVASTRVALAISLVVACPLLVLGRPFITAWLGPQYAGSTTPMLLLMGAGLAATVAWPSGAILIGMGRNAVLAVFTATSALLSIGLAVALIHPLGVTGAALAVLIGTTLESVGLALPYSMRVIGTRARPLVVDAVLPALAPAVLSLAVLYVTREALQPTSFLAIGAIGFLGAAVYAIAYLSLPSTASEREPLLAFLSGFARFARLRIVRPQTHPDK
jgi:O-antigen/teichoic acid export membrane protein